MPRYKQGKIFVCRETFALGEMVFLKDITRVREGHPIMEGREHLFKELTVHYEVERATKNPGEKRGEQR
jgi:hypothetical protein